MEQIYAPIGPNWRDGYDIVNTIPWDPAATVVPGPDCLPSINAGEGEFYYSVSELLGADNLQLFYNKGAFYKAFEWLRNGKIDTEAQYPAMFRAAAASERQYLAKCVKQDYLEGKLEIPLLPESYQSRLLRQPDTDALYILADYAQCTYRDRIGANTTPTTWIEIAALAWTMGVMIRIVRDPNDPHLMDIEKRTTVYGLQEPSYLCSGTFLTLMHVRHPDPNVPFQVGAPGQVFLGLRKKPLVDTPEYDDEEGEVHGNSSTNAIDLDA